MEQPWSVPEFVTKQDNRATAAPAVPTAAIGTVVGKVIGKYKMAKHFDVTIAETSLTVQRCQDEIGADAALDGIYVIRTPVAGSELDAADVVTGCKNLRHVERDVRHISSGCLDLHPVFHRLARVPQLIGILAVVR